jgi:hypothetical protein
MSLLAPTLQAFFTDRLIGQRRASAHTIAAYRDTIRLLLTFAAEQTSKAPTDLDIDDLAAPLIGRVPGPPRTRARQHHPHPQRAPGRDPLAVSLRRPAPPRARRHDPTRPGDPQQAHRPGARHVPH